MSLKYFFIVILPRYSMLGFITCVTIAMYLYPGGIYHMVSEGGKSLCPGASCVNLDHYTIGYSFLKNFLSDLGRTIAHGGQNNFYSSMLFNISLTFGGITYILFYFSLMKVFENKTLSILGSILGICGGIGFIGVAFTPADLYLDSHIMFNMWIFRFFLASTICYSWLMYKSNAISNKYLIGNFIFIASLIFYIFVLMYGPTPREPGGVEFQAICQKFIMLNFIGSIIIQTIGFSKIIK